MLHMSRKMGHIIRIFPLKVEQFKKGNKKFHVHVVEDDDSGKEKNNEDGDSTKEYVLISYLTRWVSQGIENISSKVYVLGEISPS